MHRFFYSSSPHVVYSISLTPKGIPYEYTYISFWIKLTQIYLSIVMHIAFSSKDSEVAEVGLSAFVQLIGSLVQALANIGSVRDVASSAHSVRPEHLRNLFLIEHAPGHLSQNPVLPLDYTVLLRSYRS